jgi:hypothetical protein
MYRLENDCVPTSNGNEISFGEKHVEYRSRGESLFVTEK